MESSPLISIIIPAYNEASGIERTVNAVISVISACQINWEILVVDDGSQDDTNQTMMRLNSLDQRIKSLRLSRNFGKENALLAGLEYASGAAMITIDADLQHPPELIPAMIAEWQAGAQIVHAVKRTRQQETRLKKTATHLINQLISSLGGIDTTNSSDFKLLDREIAAIIVNQLPEKQRFFRGLTSWIGFTEAYLYFDVEQRSDGVSKWSFGSLFELSVTALTSFTSLPLRIVSLLGIVTLILGFLIASDAIWSLIQGRAVSGFATIIISILMIGSFIMISLGIIGEYIAKIYEEVKARPHYLISNTIGIKK